MKNDNIFRAYDIRGIYPSEIDDNTSYIMGQGFGTYVSKYNINKVLVGYDNRLSSPNIHDNLIKGLLSTGVNVIDLGLVTTPMFYYARYKLDKWAGLMITASHNPKEYNGFKISYFNIGNACGDEILELRDCIHENRFLKGNGKLSTYDIKSEYIENMIKSLNFGTKKVKLIFDCGNGTGSIVIDEILNKLPVDYSLLYCTSDGTFPNHHPDPAVNENLVDLQKKVVELNYDLGIAIDADADRVRVVDNKGNIIDSDILMAIFYKNMNNKLKVRKAVYDVKCSQSLIDTLNKLNIENIMWRTGNSYLNRKFHEEKLDFAGEYSGHLYFSDNYFGYDDGIYSGLRVAELLSNSSKSLNDFNNEIPKYYSSPEIFVKSTDTKKFEIVNKVIEYAKDKGYKYIDIDGIRVIFDDGWALIRVSNTGPKLTIRFEATTKKRLYIIQNEFINLINEINI